MTCYSNRIEIRRSRPLLGTFVEITAGGLSRDLLERAVAEAFRAIEQVHRLMSFHDEASDVTRLNRFAFQNSVKIHPWTFRVLKAAQRISLKTSGLFDITVAPLLMKWGRLPSMVDCSTNKIGTFRDLRFLSGQKVRFRVPLAVDLGGIAKGFAVDQAVSKLKEQNVLHGSVNAGGDLRVFGSKAQPVYVRNPARPGEMILLAYVRETAAASSGRYFAASFVDPRIQAPVKKAYGITIFSKTCMVADALTKPVMIQAEEKSSYLRYFSAHAVKIRNNKKGDVYFDAA